MESNNAAVLTEYGKFEWKQVDMPEVSGDEVLVKVGYAGICGSDQHIFLGEFHPRTTLPLIPGHEFAGKIVKTGPGVKDFKTDDRVAIDPIIPCGKCPACKREHYPACTSLKLVGVDLDGGYSQYMKVPEHMLYKISDNISDKHAALIEVLSIGFHACNRANVGPGDSIVIWGAGKVGQCVLQAVKTKTSNKVILVDVVDERLKRAKDAYDDVYIINAMKTDPIAEIKEITNNEGVDIAFEVVGHYKEVPDVPNPVWGCVKSIRGAGTVCILGLADTPAPLLMKDLIWREATIIASRVSHGEFAETIEHLEKGTLKPDALISDVVNPSGIQEAFEMVERDPEGHLKVLLQFDNDN